MGRRLVCITLSAAITFALVFTACGDSLFNAGDQAGDAATDSAPTDAPPGDVFDILDATSDAVVDPCVSLHGPAMAPVPTTPPFCMDTTEVTLSQYKDFFTAIQDGYAPDGGPSCAWNASFLPSCSTGDAGANQPVTCINWCAASEYCAWAGKQLCGKIGGGSLTFSDVGMSSVNGWYYACTQHNTEEFPYGPTYQDGICNVPERDGAVGEIADTASEQYKGCVGQTVYAAFHDLVGNASEWIDACQDGGGGDAAIDECIRVGNSYNLDPAFSGCSGIIPTTRRTVSADIGFRCCSK